MTLLSRISGLVRDIALAYLFGASAAADLFFVALLTFPPSLAKEHSIRLLCPC